MSAAPAPTGDTWDMRVLAAAVIKEAGDCVADAEKMIRELPVSLPRYTRKFRAHYYHKALRAIDQCESDLKWLRPDGGYWLWVSVLDLTSDECSAIADGLEKRLRRAHKALLRGLGEWW